LRKPVFICSGKSGGEPPHSKKYKKGGTLVGLFCLARGIQSTQALNDPVPRDARGRAVPTQINYLGWDRLLLAANVAALELLG